MQELDLTISFLLGMVQGITEFLPISSTAHIRILPAFIQLPDVGAAYTAVIQLGSLVALFVYFRNDLKEFFFASYEELQNEWKKNDVKNFLLTIPKWSPKAKMLFYLLMGTIPISILGVLLKDWIKGPFRSLYVVGGSLIFFAILLWISDVFSKRKKTIENINLWDSLLIGFAQALALIPGASRSGVTLMAGLFLQYTRESAMRFSFLLSIPAIALSGFYELIKDWQEIRALGLDSVFVGFTSAIFFSYIAIAGLLKYLRTHNTFVFVVYRIFLGILIYLLLGLGVIQP